MSVELYIIAVMIVLWLYLFRSMLRDEEMMEEQRKRCSPVPLWMQIADVLKVNIKIEAI